MASFTYNQAFELPDSNNLNCDFQCSDIAAMFPSYQDHLTRASRSENRALVNDSANNRLESRDTLGDKTFSLAQESLLAADAFELYGSGDSTSLDPWYDAWTPSFELPLESQTDISSFDAMPDPLATELSMPLQSSLADPPSSVAAAIPSSNSYQPTPDLTECSTPASSSLPNDSRDQSIGVGSKFHTEDQRWHATLSRSRVADRCFLYGVLTTKIYCRPSCASRRPSRKHVRFFPFPGAIEAAERTSLRPCKRCKPDTLGPGNSGVLAVLHTLRNVIAEAFGNRNEGKGEGLKLESLAKSAGLSIFHFHRLFKVTTKVTPADFRTACHALSLQDYLGTYSARRKGVDDCAVHLPPRWSERTARKALGGLNPVEYANGATSLTIEYCCVSSPVGGLEVAYSGDKSTSDVKVHAVVLSQDCSLAISDHFRTSKRSDDCTQRLQQCVRELEEECRDRDVELAADVLSILWRARLWLKLTRDNGLQ